MNAKKKIIEGWHRWVSDALLITIYAGVVLALFGAFAFDHMPENPALKIALVAGGVAVLLLAGLWLDRREAELDDALENEPPVWKEAFLRSEAALREAPPRPAASREASLSPIGRGAYGADD